jgi:hypothetical protein
LKGFTSLDALGQQMSEEVEETSAYARIPLEVDVQEVSLDDVDSSVRFISNNGCGG